MQPPTRNPVIRCCPGCRTTSPIWPMATPALVCPLHAWRKWGCLPQVRWPKSEQGRWRPGGHVGGLQGCSQTIQGSRSFSCSQRTYIYCLYCLCCCRPDCAANVRCRGGAAVWGVERAVKGAPSSFFVCTCSACGCGSHQHCIGSLVLAACCLLPGLHTWGLFISSACPALPPLPPQTAACRRRLIPWQARWWPSARSAPCRPCPWPACQGCCSTLECRSRPLRSCPQPM